MNESATRLGAGDEPVEKQRAAVQAPRCGEMRAEEGRKAEAEHLHAPGRPPVVQVEQTRK